MCREGFIQFGQYQYTGLGRRFLALAADFVVFALVFFPVTKLVKGVWVMSSAEHQWGVGSIVTDPLCLMFLAVIFAYFVILEGVSGATVGKALTPSR